MNAFLAVLGLSGPELILVLVVILVLFGAKRIPEFAKGLGKGINEFKKASKEVTDSMENDTTSSAPVTPKAPPANTAPQAYTPPQPQASGQPPETKVI